MAGTKQGGVNAGITNKARYGKDFYARIGAKGGRKGHTGGFYVHRDLAATAGRVGGLKSRRPFKPERCEDCDKEYLSLAQHLSTSPVHKDKDEVA